MMTPSNPTPPPAAGLTTEREAEIRARHAKHVSWGCDCSHILAALDAARARTETLARDRDLACAAVEVEMAERATAEARAEQAESALAAVRQERDRTAEWLAEARATLHQRIEDAMDERRQRQAAEGALAAERARGDRLAGAVDALLGRCVGKMGETRWHECRVCDSAPALTADTIVHEDACAVVVARQALAAAGPVGSEDGHAAAVALAEAAVAHEAARLVLEEAYDALRDDEDPGRLRLASDALDAARDRYRAALAAYRTTRPATPEGR